MDVLELDSVIPKDVDTDSLTPPSGGTSANWGRVYQNYISANLSSKDLAKGAYDAYNLLSAGVLSKFQSDVWEAVENLEGNTTKLNEFVSKGFTHISTQGSALNKIYFPKSDKAVVPNVLKSDNFDDNFDSYDLSLIKAIPMASAERYFYGPGMIDVRSTPGFIKGKHAYNLSEIFSWAKDSYLGIPSDDPSVDITAETDESNGLKYLIRTVNLLHKSLITLWEQFYALCTGDLAMDKITSGSLNLVSPNEAETTYKKENISASKNLIYGRYYLSQNGLDLLF